MHNRRAASLLALALSTLTLTASLPANAAGAPATAPVAAAPAATVSAVRPAPFRGERWATTTNLADTGVLKGTVAALRGAGVSAARTDVFSRHVLQVNKVALKVGPLVGKPVPLARPRVWDEWRIQDAWTAAYPAFPGYNCRITAYSIYADFVTVNARKPARSRLLFLDQEALDADRSAMVTRTDRAEFERLFSLVPTTRSTDPRVQVATIRKDLTARGVRFSPSTRIRLVTVWMHDTIDKPQLFVGHTGVMLPQPDGSVFLVEKLAFQQPYQVTRFLNRQQLSDYLMRQYDDGMTDAGAPVIMENDRLIQGYRVRR